MITMFNTKPNSAIDFIFSYLIFSSVIFILSGHAPLFVHTILYMAIICVIEGIKKFRNN